MKLLLVVPRYPWPPRRGDQVRTLQFLDWLSSEHEVTLLAPGPGAGQPPVPEGVPFRVETYRADGPVLRLAQLLRASASNLPLQAGLFQHRDLSAKLRRLAPRTDLVILQLVRLAGHLQELGEAPLVVDLIDSLSLNFLRRAEVDRPWRRPALRFEARRLADGERRLLERARLGLVVSRRDQDYLQDHLPPGLRERIRVVPLAVEGQRAGIQGFVASAEGPPRLLLTGNLGYFPNADGACWWLREVWPEIRRRRPDVRVVLAGDRPAWRLRRAVRRAGAELIASPGALSPLLATATAALAPLRCGSGIPIKILEAWAAGVPVVASPWAAAGTTARSGEDLLVAETPAEWVEAVLRVLESPELRTRLTACGRSRLQADYHREAARQELLRALAT